MSRKAEILTGIVDRLAGLKPDTIKTINYQTIKLAFSDFQDWELPVIQLIDAGESVTHEMGRARKEWDIGLEIVLKSTEEGVVRQQDLFDLQNLVELELWQDPNLGIPGVIDMKYLGSQSDLAMVKPYFFVRIDFQVRYYDALLSKC